MHKIILLFNVIILTVYAYPSKESYDQATIDDINLNAISPNKEHISNYVPNNQKLAENKDVKNATPTSLNVDHQQLNVYPPNVTQPTHATGPTFTRFIEDIFQIPITILQAVSNLITNPFRANKKTPETTVSTY